MNTYLNTQVAVRRIWRGTRRALRETVQGRTITAAVMFALAAFQLSGIYTTSVNRPFLIAGTVCLVFVGCVTLVEASQLWRRRGAALGRADA